MNVQDVLSLSFKYVFSKSGRPRHEVEDLIADCIGMKRLDIYLQYDRPVDESELGTIRSGISRLAAGEPLAYILKKKSFFGYEFSVSPGVLIPRPETERLVEVASEFMRTRSSGILVDVCSGSGCIGIVLKLLFPQWHVILSDISEEALALSKKNAVQLEADVEILKGDLLESIYGRDVDCVVSNPPYLTSDEWEASSVKAYEPKIALDGGKTGLEIYERLIGQLCAREVDFVAFEIGSLQGESLRKLIEQYIGGVTPILTQDLFGRDRVVSFNREKVIK